MKSNRKDKVSRLIQKELSSIFQNDYQHIFNGIIVSITTVRISVDFSYAKIFLSIFPVKKPQEVVSLINKIKPRIRLDLGKKIRNQLRIVPDLQFYLDDSSEYSSEIERLLKK